MGMFRAIVGSAVLAGLVAGVVLTAVQSVRVIPIILEAETYETTSSDAPADGGDEAWAPADGAERFFYTGVNNVIAGIGFALLLCAAYAVRRRISAREGVLWGLAGFVTFFAGPAFGLFPEIPGTFAAALQARQAWWLLAVACTAGGLALLVLRTGLGSALAGAGLILLPHVIGAPHPEVVGGSAPALLAVRFVGATMVANFVFWVVLGTVSAGLYARRLQQAG